jgi:hypothetical protein
MLIYIVLSPPHETHATIYRPHHEAVSRYGLEAAVRYGCDLFGCQPAYCKAILKSLPLPLRVGIEKARTVAVEIRKAKNEQAQRAAAEAAEQDSNNNLKKNMPPKSCWMTWM